MNKEKRPLPIGIQDHQKLIEGGFLYIDKTKEIYDLISNGSNIYFLSRPRRFGKSLLLSTIKSIFEGKRELFKGLYIDKSDYKWEKHPVIHLSLTQVDSTSIGKFEISLKHVFLTIAESYSITLNLKLPLGTIFSDLIIKLEKKFQKKVVVLIDEYDKPLINNIKNQALAIQLREELKNIYTILKDNDPYLKFLLLTGVSKFSKVSVFSGLNNLTDLSLNESAASICGYTQKELESYFQPYFRDIEDRLPKGYDLLKLIKYWYNGYRFSDKDLKVYNPFSTLQLFWHKKFNNYWFSTGTPTFLINLIKEQNFSGFDPLSEDYVDEADFSVYEIDNLQVLPLLFQTGYLTIRETKQKALNWKYKLGFPNREVRYSFYDSLLKNLSNAEKGFSTYADTIADFLIEGNFEKLFEELKSYLARFPYNVQIPKEAYYQSILFSVFSMIYDNVAMEEPSNLGRSDIVINFKDTIYVFEIKINATAQKALQQIKEKKYYQKFSGQKKEIYLIGINFSTESRNINEWEVEKN